MRKRKIVEYCVASTVHIMYCLAVWVGMEAPHGQTHFDTPAAMAGFIPLDLVFAEIALAYCMFHSRYHYNAYMYTRSNDARKSYRQLSHNVGLTVIPVALVGV